MPDASEKNTNTAHGNTDSTERTAAETWNRIQLAGGVAADAMALRVTAETVYEAAMSGMGLKGAAHVCRALALGLRTLERDAIRAAEPDWRPPDNQHPLDPQCFDGQEDA